MRDTHAPTSGPATARYRMEGNCATLRQARGKFPMVLTETPIITHQSENISYRRAIVLLFSLSVVSESLDPMNRSTPGLPVHHHLPEFTQTHVHQVSDAIQPSHPLLPPSPPASNPLYRHRQVRLQSRWSSAESREMLYQLFRCLSTDRFGSLPASPVSESHSVVSDSLRPHGLPGFSVHGIL